MALVLSVNVARQTLKSGSNNIIYMKLDTGKHFTLYIKREERYVSILVYICILICILVYIYKNLDLLTIAYDCLRLKVTVMQ